MEVTRIADAGAATPLIAERPDVIFHLAAIVSGEAEAEFDKGYRINLDGTRYLIDAIRAIVREATRPDIAEIARTLTRRLREVTDEFLRHENRDRPDVLKIVMAPSLAPGDRLD